MYLSIVFKNIKTEFIKIAIFVSVIAHGTNSKNYKP